VASAVLAYQHFVRTRAITPSVLFADYDDAFDKVVEAASTMDEVWICDLSWKMTNIGLIDHLAHIRPDRLLFFDHHRSSRDCFDAWKDRATFFFDDSGESCTADLIWQYMISQGHAPDDMVPIVSAAHSRDLWIRNDPNGCEISSVIDELGAGMVFQALAYDSSLIQIKNFPREWHDICKRAAQKLEKSYLVARNTMTKASVRNAEGAMVPVMACIALGSISEVGERILTEEGGGFIGFIDLAHGGLSFRSTFPTIEKMGFGVNEIACTLHPNGGGHPVASGCGKRCASSRRRPQRPFEGHDRSYSRLSGTGGRKGFKIKIRSP
jgi:oligoribonuclease NrnB/cAMP/cGMP phosphodiesterase (DHH superfamily)